MKSRRINFNEEELSEVSKVKKQSKTVGPDISKLSRKKSHHI